MSKIREKLFSLSFYIETNKEEDPWSNSVPNTINEENE